MKVALDIFTVNATFVRSGQVATASLRFQGHNCFDLSQVATAYGVDDNGIYDFYLYFTTYGVFPSTQSARWNGFPVRCLV